MKIWAAIVQEDGPCDGEMLFKVRFSSEVPIRIATRIFNVVTELRAALDHAVFASAVALTGRANPSAASFPFGDTPATFEQEFMNKGAHIPPSVLTAIIALKPYETGNRALWRLNKLRNMKDHRKLVIPAPSAHVVRADIAGSNAAVFHLVDRASPDDDYTIARVTGGLPGSKMKLELGLVFHVSMDEPVELRGVDPVIFLNEASLAVRGAVAAIERATITSLAKA